MSGYFIVLVDTNEDPLPLRGPFDTFDQAVDAHYAAAVESGYEPEEGIDAHSYYLTDDAVHIGSLGDGRPPDLMVEVVYEVTAHVPEDGPIPDEDEMALALYRGVECIPSEKHVEVRRA